jgi:hypothetical protein
MRQHSRRDNGEEAGYFWFRFRVRVAACRRTLRAASAPLTGTSSNGSALVDDHAGDGSCLFRCAMPGHDLTVGHVLETTLLVRLGVLIDVLRRPDSRRRLLELEEQGADARPVLKLLDLRSLGLGRRIPVAALNVTAASERHAAAGLGGGRCCYASGHRRCLPEGTSRNLIAEADELAPENA